jgi:hypothetical protein
MRWRVASLMCLVAAAHTGCGLLLQGREQPLRISSVPPGARVSIDGDTFQTPAQITIPRRSSDSLVRVHKDDYYSACSQLEWESDPLLVTLDSIPLAIPLVIDLVNRTLPGYIRDINVPLDAIPPGYPDINPSDEEIRQALDDRDIDLCDPPPQVVPWIRLRSRFGSEMAQVIAIQGKPTRSYETLGQVEVRVKGVDWWSINVFAELYGFPTLFYTSYNYTESQAGVNAMLKLKAVAQFGGPVDAVVDIRYDDLPGYDVSGTGVAVHFTDQGEPTQQPHSASERLGELKRLLNSGTISRSEYEQKRKAILNGL